MKWSEICIHTTHEAIEPISNILHEAGAGGVVIEDPEDLKRDWPDRYGEIYALDPNDYPDEGVNIKAYFPVNSFLGETIEQIKEAINNLLLHDIDIGSHTITVSEVNEDEWATAWKKYYKAKRVTDRLTIVPTWEDYRPESPEEIVIELDPGMAFGTGTHPTTVLCLSAIERYLRPGDRVLDVGTGTGVLSIACAKLGAQSVDAVDLDEVAVKVAGMNVRLNKVQDRVRVQRGNLADHLTGPYDLIVANILAEVILRLINDAGRLLDRGGRFIASGIILKKKEEVKQRLIEAGFAVDEESADGDWIALICRKL
ncbi:50S ribosomal protein L11 methyltransferase [Caenibacillus caldisaponilyticus]|jgi:ribosomal protein L11 methyltransferase|uniref:50S ribosomal protein L11 methyltransferase n=1 Tax=Caenibacillus caldisaponilyticus TaxID=1674942 RepID=UPI0009884706|nr:50S ribosomal protein L11 methyltransferase [Caenibacillus caldisaponilyticus]